MQGQLFTHYFLTDGIKATPEWSATENQPHSFEELRKAVSRQYEALLPFHEPNETVTEEELIRPVLKSLGWTDYLGQQSPAGEDIPDLLLFADAESKQRAAERSSKNRFPYATVVEESKRFGLSLDARDKKDKVQPRTPHGQILRYLSTADVESESKIRWGFLTNGGVWRLYDYRARPRASGYYEADLATLLEPGNVDELRVFYLLFRRESFVRQQGATDTFLEAALAEGKRYEEQVAKDLSEVVFEEVFPSLVKALAESSGADLEEVRQAALIFLYRLLFVLYAEDRGLLPVNDQRYDDYGLRKGVRDHISNRMDDKDTFSARAANYWNRLTDLFQIIDKGDPSIGLPPYNGGLFAVEAAPLLERVRLSDATLASIVYNLSHAEDSQGKRRFVNFRDMSVQQLGSIYERLLERNPVRTEDGKIVIRPNSYARKDSGSFFTPQELVDLIVDHTLKPLAEERLRAFEDKAAQLKSDRRPKAKRKTELLKLDPAEAVLRMKVLDPAMGSGHFLVTAVDFLSDYIADMIEYVPVVPEWLNGDYVSPLVKRITKIRGEIIQRAINSNWALDETQLTDQAIIRRMVLKRCIYGVDKNPLTVELAKVSLWLHSFTVGAPLSFLDHHLRCGDSLVGLKVSEATDDLRRINEIFLSSAIAGAEASAKEMRRIENFSDSDISEVRQSAKLFESVHGLTADLRGLLNFFCGYKWLTAGMKKKAFGVYETKHLFEPIGRFSTKAFQLLANGPEDIAIDCSTKDEETLSRFGKLWHEGMKIARDESFLHWEVAFPGVWRHWQSLRPEGGFDAVIGNPPWDRIKLQEVEWFATREPELALAPTASARKAGIMRLRAEGAPLAAEFDAAKDRADKLSQLFRQSGHYPLLGRGDINLYSLFVERSMNLIKPDGFVGLLTPSGIYADKTAATFFKSLSTNGRVSGLFDFENKKIFFKDIHASFKFCALIFGGEKRRFQETRCAFFLHNTKTIADQDRCFPLSPTDFARVNPNTGTAPIFRTRRDAEITRAIYERHPVLVDRSGGQEQKAWPLKYATMFHMASNSHLFRTAAQLDAEGFYLVASNRWKRGEELYLPLYQGRMIHQFDHRANSVRYNPESTHNPYLSVKVTEVQHAAPDFLPQTQYWVPALRVEKALSQCRGYTLGFRDIARPTDARTMIASILPLVGCGHKLPLLLPTEDDLNCLDVACILANLNSFAFDYVARQKVQATNLTWYTVEQFSIIAPPDYDRPFGDKTARELVRDHVLGLTYTAYDMAPFARDLGYNGEPFIWNEEERRHLRARLDALYFHLYGINRDDAGYILSTFPIVQREDETEFGTYRTRDLILAYMNALAAGDTETVVAV